jgi:hypothetical protein
VARRGQASHAEGFTCEDGGWTSPGVAACLPRLAPNLAPRKRVNSANVGRARWYRIRGSQGIGCLAGRCLSNQLRRMLSSGGLGPAAALPLDKACGLRLTSTRSIRLEPVARDRPRSGSRQYRRCHHGSSVGEGPYGSRCPAPSSSADETGILAGCRPDWAVHR